MSLDSYVECMGKNNSYSILVVNTIGEREREYLKDL